MKLNRFSTAVSVLAAGVLTLSACAGTTTSTAGVGKVVCGGKKVLTASGATFQAKAMDHFVNSFERACPGQTLNYTASNSGVGIREFISKQTDFGGSDSPLDRNEYAAAEQRCGSRAWNLPMVFGPLAIAYNVKGLSSLNLDGPAAAKIFNGAVTTWNDPSIQALNSDVALPAEPIHVVFRNDEAGTTDNFQEYLHVASGGAWGKGTGRTFNGGVGEGAKGDGGTAASVESTEGAITYVAWSVAREHELNMAKIITSAGPDPVAISTVSVDATISEASMIGNSNDLVLDTLSFYRPTKTGSYPIVEATYEIVCSKYPGAQEGAAVKAFMQSSIGAGQDGLREHGYTPVPDQLKQRLSVAVNAIS